jgi:catechol 2,3-dioxygenase-like lactoylglutathione lyase family enzyme
MSDPLPIQGFHHISRTTRNVEASVEFYRDLLGFRELSRPPFSFRGAWLFGFGIQIHIIENAEYREARQEIDSKGDHIAFRVEDTEAIKERLTQEGIPFIFKVNAGGIPQVFIHDPDGHQVELAVVGDPSMGYEP